jgi:hypothetical protein
MMIISDILGRLAMWFFLCLGPFLADESNQHLQSGTNKFNPSGFIWAKAKRQRPEGANMVE